MKFEDLDSFTDAQYDNLTHQVTKKEMNGDPNYYYKLWCENNADILTKKMAQHIKNIMDKHEKEHTYRYIYPYYRPKI